jgi:hypothetical protein
MLGFSKQHMRTSGFSTENQNQLKFWNAWQENQNIDCSGRNTKQHLKNC